MLCKTRGIVLHAIPYNDKYSIIYMYTEAFGRTSYLVARSRGKKSPVSRALFMPLSVLEMEVEHLNKRDLHRIRETKLCYPLTEVFCNPVKNVLALIKQTRGDITLNECADRLNYNPSYIWKVLRTEKDTSFSDLANNEKLEMAKELLLTSDMTVVQIAETLNYSNVQNFIRFFSKYENTTPGRYRKEHKKEGKAEDSASESDNKQDPE